MNLIDTDAKEDYLLDGRFTVKAGAEAQSEITEEDAQEWCYKRGLTIIDNALYLEMRSRWSASVDVQPEQRWNPCSKGLPKKNGDYYVTTHNGQIARYIFIKGVSEEYWMRCATAWMPLPKPYRPQ